MKSKSTPKVVTTVYAGDWTAIYFDGNFAFEGQGINMQHVLEAMGIESNVRTVEARIEMPKRLEDLGKTEAPVIKKKTKRKK